MLFLESSLVKIEYLILFSFLIFVNLFTSFIIGASFLLARQNPDSEKLSAYECGFEPYEDTRKVIDVRFCVIAMLFLVFDLEVMFVMPWLISLSKLDLLGFWSMIDFLLECAVGYFYLLYAHGLNWEN